MSKRRQIAEAMAVNSDNSDMVLTVECGGVECMSERVLECEWRLWQRHTSESSWLTRSTEISDIFHRH